MTSKALPPLLFTVLSAGLTFTSVAACSNASGEPATTDGFDHQQQVGHPTAGASGAAGTGGSATNTATGGSAGATTSATAGTTGAAGTSVPTTGAAGAVATTPPVAPTTPVTPTAPPVTPTPPAAGGPVARPASSTGTGFYVVGNKLYDPKGVEFHARGVNKLHSSDPSPGIPKTHANIERWVIDLTMPVATNIGFMKDTIANHIVPMPGVWEGTCNEDPSVLSHIVDEWVAQAPQWTTLNDKIIINIANEWGPSGSTVWRDAYITAVGRMRAAGYTGTLSITSGGCGQDNDDIVKYGAAVLASDPQKNLIFDQHIYGIWADGNGMNWQIDLKTGLDALVSSGLAVIVGEFGPGRDIGPSATLMTPDQIIQAADSRGIGWLAWAWDDPAYNADDSWFALSRTGDYNSTADLTMFGQDVVENPSYGLKAKAVPNTAF